MNVRGGRSCYQNLTSRAKKGPNFSMSPIPSLNKLLGKDILAFTAFNFALSNVLRTWKVFALPRPHYFIKTYRTHAYIVNRKLGTKYKKVLAFLAFLFRFTLRPSGNKSLTILIKDSLNVTSLYIIKIKVT